MEKEGSLNINSKKELDEIVFNKIVKDDLEIDLIPKSGKYDYVFIFMHGLFGNPEEYVEIFNKKDGPIPDKFKIVLPCASNEYVSRIGSNTTSWFDLTGINHDIITEKDISFEDMEKNGERISQLIKNEARKLNNDSSKIFVGGFSQGACMAYHVGLSLESTLGGIVCFSGIPVSKTKIRNNRNEELNILSIIGGKDIYFTLDYSKNQIKNILPNFKKLQLKELMNEAHSVTAVGLEEMKKFISSLIKQNFN